MRKWILFLLAFVMAFQGMVFTSGIYGDDNFIIKKQKYKVGDDEVLKVYPNQNFQLILELGVPDSVLKGDGYNVTIEENSSFDIWNSLEGAFTDNGIKKETLELNMYYKGGDDTTLDIIFDYDVKPVKRTIYIDVLSESGSSSPSSSRGNPNLIVSGGSIPTVKGGEKAKINIPIENIGSTTARNITVVMELDENSPFEVEKLNTTYTIDRINPRKTENAFFNLKVSDSAEEKTYSVKLSYHYSGLSGGEGLSGSDRINIKVENSKNPPRLILSAIGYGDKPLIASEKNTVSAIIRNTGTLEAKDIKVSLKGLSGDGFALYKAPDLKQLESLGGNKVTQVDYILIPSVNMSTGNYDLGLKLDYKDHKGKSYSEEVSFFLPVKGVDTTLSDIVIEDIEAPDGEVKVEEDFRIAFDVVNKSSVEANEVKVSLNNDSHIICKSLNVKSLGKLSKDEKRKVEFELYPSYEAVTRNYPIEIHVEFENGLGEKKVKNTITQYVGVFVNRGSGGGTPRIIVDRYNIEPATIKAGDVFQLNMSLLNTSSSNTVSNIKVSLSNDEGVFNPVNSSNTIFIESIGPKKKVENIFTLMPKRDAEHKTYGVVVDIDYEDGKGNQVNSKDMISIDVIQQAKLVLGDLDMPPEVYVGQPFPISIEFFNMGKTTLHNLMIKTEGNFSTQDSSYYVGNFEAGQTDYYEVGVIPEGEGHLKGEISFTFENAVGEPYEVIEEFEVNVIEMMMEPMPDDGMGEVPEDTGFKAKLGRFTKNPYTILGMFIICGGIIFGVKRIQKKKREMTFDE